MEARNFICEDKLYKLIGNENGYRVKVIYLTDDELYLLTGKYFKDCHKYRWPHFMGIPIKERK